MLGLIHRMARNLAKSRQELGNMVDLALGRGVFDEEAAEALEEALIFADVGPETAGELIQDIKAWVSAAGGGVTRETVIEAMGIKIERILAAQHPPKSEGPPAPPEVWIVVGVNGSGKTTTAARLAAREKQAGRKVLLGAADTFRAAAVEQLKIWGERIDAEVVSQGQGADPAAVAFDSVQAGIARGADVVIIDTAGRLHTKVNLMNELSKVVSVVGKLHKPDEILLVLDATTGQNGIRQVASFKGALPLTGLVVTKLDGTSKAGVVIRASREFQVPVKYIGTGESAEDLMPFDARSFAEALLKP